tara:strand:+ start:339 stop:569 length:231 start_codon:yes stop_codon:yes gene_type:complete
MKCFEQKETKEFSFKDDKGRTIFVSIDWSIHTKGTQLLNIDIYDKAELDKAEYEEFDSIYSTEIDLNENYGHVYNK